MNDEGERYAIIVDGTAALPPDLARERDIRILPLHVNFGERTFTAGADLTAERFYELLREPGARPTTSQPSPGECQETFEAAVREGAQRILVVTVAKELSGTYSAVTQAAQEMSVPIEVVDSRSTAGAIALNALACARARREGSGFAEAVALARRLAGQVRLYAVIDTLEQLKRSGRASGMQAMFGSLLSIKPIIKIEEGVVQPLDKVRSREKALERLKELIEADTPPGSRIHAATLHTEAPSRGADLGAWLSGRYECAEHYVAEAGPVLAAHGGPGLVGVCWYPESARGA